MKNRKSPGFLQKNVIQKLFSYVKINITVFFNNVI